MCVVARARASVCVGGCSPKSGGREKKEPPGSLSRRPGVCVVVRACVCKRAVHKEASSLTTRRGPPPPPPPQKTAPPLLSRSLAPPDPEQPPTITRTPINTTTASWRAHTYIPLGLGRLRFSSLRAYRPFSTQLHHQRPPPLSARPLRRPQKRQKRARATSRSRTRPTLLSRPSPTFGGKKDDQEKRERVVKLGERPPVSLSQFAPPPPSPTAAGSQIPQ